MRIGPNARPLMGQSARFETWREQIDYLAAQAAESGLDDALRAVEGARTMLEAAAAPPLPPALCHLDWHMGNVLCDAAGGLSWVPASVGVSHPQEDYRYGGRVSFALSTFRRCKLAVDGLRPSNRKQFVIRVRHSSSSSETSGHQVSRMFNTFGS